MYLICYEQRWKSLNYVLDNKDSVKVFINSKFVNTHIWWLLSFQNKLLTYSDHPCMRN